MAKHLLDLADSAESEGVQLAATNSALDRGGLAAKTAVSVEVSAKPFELVFERIMSGPRDPTTQPALTSGDESELEPDVIEGEYDDPPLPEESEVIDSGYTDAEPDVIDVEVMADDPVPITPDEPHESLSGPLSGALMTLTEANEQAARIRNMKRR